MKKLILNIALFFCILFVILLSILFLLPNPFLKNSLIGAVIDKNKILSQTKPPKIILVGGSSVSFGTDSKKIQDAYKLPVIN